MGAALGPALPFLERLVSVSLVNVATIFVAIGLFCHLFPRKKSPWLIVFASSGACAVFTLASAVLSQVLRPQVIEPQLGAAVGDIATMVFFTLVLGTCLWLAHALYEMSGWDAVFCCTAGYALQNLAHSAYDVVNAFLPPEVPQLVSALVHVLIAAAIFYAAWKTFIRRIHVQHLEGSGDARTALVLAGVIAVNIILSTTINTVRNLPGIEWGVFASLRFTQLFVSVLMLYLDYEILYSNHMRVAVAAERQLAEDQRRQYELSAETIEAINVRCHDIRHQVRRLGENLATGQAFMAEVSDLINVYDSSVQTGNRALDVILSEKTMLAQSKDVQLTCVADGSVLDFMEEQDVYSLFGNALDNALEAAQGLREPERRLIDLSVRRLGQMAVVQVRNYYDEEPTPAAQGGSLVSTKKDGGLHGYGTKSMRLIAERYDGSISYEADDGLFRLTLLLPLP